MPQPTKIFRVFVSSTFTDMKEERRLLQKDVFPKLERFCEENGAKFQAVDLRWGVTEESSLNQKTLDICLNEISRCQKLSPKPNFLILLGDKYGWQPIPSHIPATEMKTIMQVAGNKEILEEWYQKDDNAIPPEFVLQPRGKAYEKYEDWEIVEKEIQKVLKESVLKSDFSAKQKVKYFASATHQEILAGALHEDKTLENPGEHVFCFNRTIIGLPDDERARNYRDILDGKPDQNSMKQLEMLKKELRDRLVNQFVDYSARWKNDVSIIDKPTEKFTDKVYKFLKDIIQEQLDRVVSEDEIHHEASLHERFKEQLTEHFKGREKILSGIESYLNNGKVNKPLALIGESGSGKSSVMAKAIEKKENEKGNSILVYRFIGTTSGSTNLVSLLQSVSGQIAKEYNTTLEELAGEGNEKNLHEIYGISEVFRKSLALATPEKPLAVFLDALDQLTTREESSNSYWMPDELPEDTRLVVSALEEYENVLSGTNQTVLPKLPPDEARDILHAWFDNISRNLTSEQEDLILQNNDKAILPIYLKLAFEQAKKWESYKKDFSLKNDVPGIINDFIDSLSAEHNAKFVQDVICLMLCGRYQGLAENEILEIFAFDKELWDGILSMSHEDHRKELEDLKKELGNSMKIPIALWSRLFLDLEPFLTERDADGVPIIVFFHRQFNEVLEQRYGLVEAE